MKYWFSKRYRYFFWVYSSRGILMDYFLLVAVTHWWSNSTFHLIRLPINDLTLNISFFVWNLRNFEIFSFHFNVVWIKNHSFSTSKLRNFQVYSFNSIWYCLKNNDNSFSFQYYWKKSHFNHWFFLKISIFA